MQFLREEGSHYGKIIRYGQENDLVERKREQISTFH